MNADKIPFAVISFLAVQLAGAVWWGAQITSTANFAEETAIENRRYISEVVIPSYEISDNWDNPHYNNWLTSGGWKD